MHSEQNREEIMKQIHSQIPVQFPTRHLFKKFITLFYSNLSLEDLQSRSTVDLYGAVLSHWHFIFNHSSSDFKLRIYNPSDEKHSWNSSHTVIEFISQDMPFIVDSMSMEINRLGYNIHLIIHLGGINIERDAQGEIQNIYPADQQHLSAHPEAPIQIEIDRRTNPEDLKYLEDNLVRVLNDVKVAVEDWGKMRQQAFDSLSELESNKNLSSNENDLSESKAFLRWMLDNHFTFLGCRDYNLVQKDGQMGLELIPQSGLGVLRDKSLPKGVRHFKEIPPAVRTLALSDQNILIAKSNTISSVHRPAYTDYISVKLYDDAGRAVGERRFIGLFTSLAYHCNPDQIPFLRQKSRRIMASSGLSERGHAYKELRNIIEIFPRDDLFQASFEELYEMCMGILRMQERSRIRLFTRQDIYGRFISALVYVPKDRYNNELKKKFVKVFERVFSSHSVTYSAYFSESVLARIHFMIRVNPSDSLDYDLKAIEKALVSVARSWGDQLRDILLEQFGEELGNSLYVSYGEAFPAGYRENFDPHVAADDIRHIESINADDPLAICLYQTSESKTLRFKLFQPNQTIPLSDVLPVLEDMGLRVIGEDPYEVVRVDEQKFWVNNFSMELKNEVSFDLHAIKENFQNAFQTIWFGCSESDQINYLVLTAQLTWRQCSLLRAYARYLRQTGFTYSQSYIEETLAAYPEHSKQLITLFEALFSPEKKYKKSEIKVLKNIFLESLDAVDILDQDKILRQIYGVINATLRTNFFQIDKNTSCKAYIAFKFDSSKVPDLPLPRPTYEIFVFSPRFEGIHLRMARVARGGLRWSDRREDFRTEVLGLMKAQQVKNALIVPQGAKGGFVTKRLPNTMDRDKIMNEVIYCYKSFISGLLDLTDNFVEGKIVPPENVRRHDGDDPYLVVAADKGTATFSDIANKIARGYNFWLDDAFASGGSKGYDHKQMGITARGAWESVKHLFRSLEINIQKQSFTAIGIGDMAGDVFGNGVLLSKQMKLMAAFNHLHIFIDPTPDSTKSHQERKRLFHLPRSSWEDYNADLISQGGGIFKRSAKSIPLSSEVKKVFGIKKDSMAPNDLIKTLLCAKVDLLWNGGIGTFVKAEKESHLDVGDRTNDAIRVDGKQLRCRVVGEGGNLGLTQLGRVEYALNGGLINTDFIDNSAGVDCSDCEVNIKILLNDVITKGDLTEEQRNALLAEMTDEVAGLVLQDNYMQAQILSISMNHPLMTVDLYSQYAQEQEEQGKLNRKLEFLPDQETLQARKASSQGFTRPELCVLLAYSKNILKQDILNSTVPEEPAVIELLKNVFPKKLSDCYWEQIKSHRLNREIIATYLSNRIVNYMGIAFIHRSRNETGADVASIVRAYCIAESIFGAPKLWEAIQQLDHRVAMPVQIKMLLEVFRLVQRATRWFLRNQRNDLAINQNIEYFERGVQSFISILPRVLIGAEKKEMEASSKEYVASNVPESLAHRIAGDSTMFSALDLIQTAKANELNLEELASIYFILGERLNLSWLRQKVRYHPVSSLWDGLARSALRDDLDQQQCELSVSILNATTNTSEKIEFRVDEWLSNQNQMVSRWNGLLADLRSSTPSFTIYLVAVRELMELTQSMLQKG